MFNLSIFAGKQEKVFMIKFVLALQLKARGQFNKTFTSVAIVFRLLNNGYTCKLQV